MVKYLILGPGGMVGLKMLGVLVRLKELGRLDDLQEISGSSVGSLIALFYIIFEGDLSKVVKIAIDFNIKTFTKPHVKNLISKYGLIDTSILGEKIIELIGGNDVTFKELYDIFPIKLHINAFELLSNKTVYMSTETTPDFSVVTAVLRSISIPIIFTPNIVDSTQIFLDGSTIDLVPAEPFLGVSFNDVIELRTVTSTSGPSHKPKSFMEYLMMIVGRIAAVRRTFDGFKRIDIESTNEEVINFSASDQEKTRMYLEGYEKSFHTVEINCH